MFWCEFAVLYAGALVGALAIVPYLLRLVKSSTKPRKAPPAVIAFAGFVQNAIFFAAVVAGGLYVARLVGLHPAPYIDAALAGRFAQASLRPLECAAVIGVAAGVVLIVADLVFLPRMPALLALSRKASIMENFLACFYGGINEELLTRLLGVSGVVWLIARFTGGVPSHPSDAAFWEAIAVMAVVFGLGHLPATASITKITPLILFRALLLNGVVAVPCGWLFWRYGIEAAIVTHFTVDIVYHVFGTMLLKMSDRVRGVAPPA